MRNDKITPMEVMARRPEGVILSPGPCTPDDAGICLNMVTVAAQTRLPLLGVCLGHQAIGQALGGIVVRETPRHGKLSSIRHRGKGLFKGLPDMVNATRYHSLVVERDSLPAHFEVTAETEDRLIMGMNHRELPIHGLQFHPEVTHTNEGSVVIENFATKICNANPSWKMDGLIAQKIDKLKRLSEEINCPIITAMQMNRSGENFNRKGAAVVDDSSAIALSDRLQWFASFVAIFRRKTVDEIAIDGENFAIQAQQISIADSIDSSLDEEFSECLVGLDGVCDINCLPVDYDCPQHPTAGIHDLDCKTESDGRCDIKCFDSDWDCLTIEAQGWGVIQMPKPLIIDTNQGLKDFYRGMKNAYEIFIDKETKKMAKIREMIKDF